MIQQTNQKYTPRTNKVSYKIVNSKNYNLWIKIILVCYSLTHEIMYVGCVIHKNTCVQHSTKWTPHPN